MGRTLKPVEGATVRLLRDIQTRGKRRFLAGLQMKIGHTDRCFALQVYVRCRKMRIDIEKKYWTRYFVVLSVPPKKPEEKESED